MKKYVNYTIFSVLLFILFTIFIFVGKYYFKNIIIGDLLIVIYSIFNYFITKIMYKNYLKKEYRRDYISIGQIYYGRVPLGLIGRDMDVSPCVSDNYHDCNLTRLKLQYRFALIFIIVTLFVLIILN